MQTCRYARYSSHWKMPISSNAFYREWFYAPCGIIVSAVDYICAVVAGIRGGSGQQLQWTRIEKFVINKNMTISYYIACSKWAGNVPKGLLISTNRNSSEQLLEFYKDGTETRDVLMERGGWWAVINVSAYYC